MKTSFLLSVLQSFFSVFVDQNALGSNFTYHCNWQPVVENHTLFLSAHIKHAAAHTGHLLIFYHAAVRGVIADFRSSRETDYSPEDFLRRPGERKCSFAHPVDRYSFDLFIRPLLADQLCICRELR